MNSKRFNVGKYAMILVFVAMFVIFSIVAPNFLTISNIFTVAKQIAVLGICACGMTVVMVSGGIDLTMGWHISLANVVCAKLMVDFGLPPLLACILVLAEGILLGLLLGTLVIKTKVVPVIICLGMLNILDGTSFVVSKGMPIFGFPNSFGVIGRGYVFKVVPISMIIMAIVFVVVGILLKKTYIGRYFYAVGSNTEAAKLSGINVDMTKLLAYIICGFLTALGAIVLLSRTNSGISANGDGFEFDVVTACVLGGVSASGGKGTIGNTFTGVLIVGFLENGLLLLGASAYTQLIVKGALMLVAVSYDNYNRIKETQVRKVKAINAENVA